MAGNSGGGVMAVALPGVSRQDRVMLRLLVCLCLAALPLSSMAQPTTTRPDMPGALPARNGTIPHARWDHRADAPLLTRSALSALKAHGAPLPAFMPRDIASWCPAYATAKPNQRRAFWVGFLSALAKHESTYNPRAIGGGGRWHGLLQILPATARGYGCRAGDGAALRHGPANLSCAIRIMTHTVRRDGVISEGMRGVAADWGPLHNQSKRRDMQAWLRAQRYCRPVSTVRPRPRPARRVSIAK